MLYVSTRSKTDSFTSYRALHEEYAPDGGMFVPMRMPVFTCEEIQSLEGKSFGECVALVLNQFFSVELTGWDVDFLIGRHPFRLTTMSHRLIIGELWRNHESDYSYTERCIYDKLCDSASKQPTDWARTAIRIAMLFGLYGELLRQGIAEVDIAVPAGDFSLPMAVWYGRIMGLPVGTIICGCNENGTVWDLVHRGECSTNPQIVHTEFPLLDVGHPASIERLIYGVFGLKESQRYLDICARHGVYTLADEDLQMMNSGLFAAVVSGRRTRSIIASMYRTNRYITDGCAAVAYGSLQDYRARTGESRPTLLLADRSPVHSMDSLAAILGIAQEELIKQL